MIASAFSRFIEILNDVNKKQEDDDGDIEIEEEKLNDDEENNVQRFTRYKESMLLLLSDLCSDGIPIVRRSAIISLGKMLSCLDRNNLNEVINSYLPLFKKLSSDDQDNVRVFAIETLISFDNIFTKKENKINLLYHIRLLCIEQAYRYR